MKVYVLIILTADKLRYSEVKGVYHSLQSAKRDFKNLIGEDEFDIYEKNEFLEAADDYVIYRIQPIETQD